MKIIPIKYGESVLPESMIFPNGDKAKISHIDFIVYLIQYDNKTILVDAGCETMPGFDMRNFIGSVNAIKSKGFLPEEITDVVITHSHHDHIECVKYFKNAIVHIQKDEYEIGKKYIPNDMRLNIFNDRYSICDDIEIIKIGGHTKGSCIVEVRNCGDCYVIVGDECYIRGNFAKKIPTGTSYCPKRSIEFLKKYGDGKYVILLCHDK